MQIVGATGRGLLERLVRGSLVLAVVYEVECSVLRAEQEHDQSILQGLRGN